MRFRRNHQERNHRQRIETIATIQGPSNRRTEGIQGTQAHEERLNHQGKCAQNQGRTRETI